MTPTDGQLTSELREAALAYARLGWRVVPVEARGKRPSDGRDWQTPRYRRSAAEISAHWRMSYNVGVLLGPESGELVDVDLDCEEARALAGEFLPPGAFVFGRPSAVRSHRLYRSPGAHLVQLKDLSSDRRPGAMLVELRALPMGGAGVQTVLPPSIHVSGERIGWDTDCADGQELPAVVDAAALTAAVRGLAVAAFLAKHLGAVVAAREYLQSPRSGLLRPEVAAHARQLAGLPRARETRTARAASGSDLSFEKLRRAGVENMAAILGLDWDSRPRALVVCPACKRDTRSDHDRRSAAGTFKASDSGVELWTHAKCGHPGDAVALASAELLGTLRPSKGEQSGQLLTQLRARGWR